MICVIHNSNWNFHEPILEKNTYFKNHIEWTVHNCQIFRQCPSFKRILIQHYPFLYWVKFFLNITFNEVENDKLLRQDDAPSNLYSLIGLHRDQRSFFMKLRNSCSLIKFQDISKFTAPRFLDPHTFHIKINASKHFKLLLRKSLYS